MKSFNSVILPILTVCVIAVPLYSLSSGESKKENIAVVASVNTVSKTETKAKSAPTATNTVRVYDAETEKITVMDMNDYLYGVVAGECPMLYHDEAIKAQIVAARTYTLFRCNENKNKKYDISTDSQTSQAFISKETAMKNWGSSAKKYDKKLTELIKEVKNEAILYKNKPILAVYHAISSGKTESCKNVWGSDYSYLQSVESTFDKLANGYLSECKKNTEQADEILKSRGVSATALAGGKVEKTGCGNVLRIIANGKTVTGADIVELFDLRSQNFDICIKNKQLCFTVRGYGHQAGMSQNGANFMANDGNDYKAILKHYYKGVTVEKYETK